MFPDSRSLLIWPERFGFTGIGGGGMAESSESMDRWRLFRIASSSLRARYLEVVVMAFEVGSK